MGAARAGRWAVSETLRTVHAPCPSRTQFVTGGVPAAAPELWESRHDRVLFLLRKGQTCCIRRPCDPVSCYAAVPTPGHAARCPRVGNMQGGTPQRVLGGGPDREGTAAWEAVAQRVPLPSPAAWRPHTESRRSFPRARCVPGLCAASAPSPSPPSVSVPQEEALSGRTRGTPAGDTYAPTRTASAVGAHAGPFPSPPASNRGPARLPRPARLRTRLVFPRSRLPRRPGEPRARATRATGGAGTVSTEGAGVTGRSELRRLRMCSQCRRRRDRRLTSPGSSGTRRSCCPSRTGGHTRESERGAAEWLRASGIRPGGPAQPCGMGTPVTLLGSPSNNDQYVL